jgi:sensor histidine kinase YesM
MSPRVHAFFRNDLDYAPFGLTWLRGFTPARMGIVALFCLFANPGIHNMIARFGLTAGVLRIWSRTWAAFFVSAIPFVLLVLWADRRTASSATSVRVGAFAFATLVGAAVMSAGMMAWPALFGGRWQSWPLYSLFFYTNTVIGGMCCATLFFFERDRQARRRLMQARLARVAAERQIVEARLQLLRAQIEPHFLFNSLASVKLLYQQQVAGGKGMLRNLSTYLRSAIERGQGNESTLAEQVAMARAFLEILRERMGERLRIRIDVPADLQMALLPPLMLGTLVENAVKHGIAPRASGGTIAISARSDGIHLRVEVFDDGVGFHGDSGTGVGLANTRARLASIYGEGAELELGGNHAGGVTAAIRIPLRFGSAQVPALAAIDRLAQDVPRRTTFAQRFAAVLGWRQWAWAMAIAVCFSASFPLATAASPYDMTGLAWVFVSLEILIAAMIFMLAVVAVEAAPRDSAVPSIAAYFCGWVGAAAVIAALAWSVGNVFPEPPLRGDAGKKWATQFRPAGGFNERFTNVGEQRGKITLGGFGILVYVWLRRSRQANEALAKAEIARAEVERRLLASQVEALEAEVDPAVVFSTLETIENTYEHDRVTADAMLDELISFLRSAIPKVRSGQESVIARPEEVAA